MVGIVAVTPAMAKEWLDRSDPRHPVLSHVQALSKIMAEGRWLPGSDPIVLTSDGQLVKGKHRLLAVVEANVTVEMLVLHP